MKSGNEFNPTRCDAIHPEYGVQCVRIGDCLTDHLGIVGAYGQRRYIAWPIEEPEEITTSPSEEKNGS